jgi:hypothetical protein
VQHCLCVCVLCVRVCVCVGCAARDRNLVRVCVRVRGCMGAWVHGCVLTWGIEHMGRMHGDTLRQT